jgi:CheY-like chemotaxis protein
MGQMGKRSPCLEEMERTLLFVIKPGSINGGKKTMTAQISDSFYFRGKEYSLIGESGGDLASPQRFGIRPISVCNSCYRGYYATYELTNEALYLRELSLFSENDYYPPIQGITPVKYGEYDYYTYEGLNLMMNFTGKMRLAYNGSEALDQIQQKMPSLLVIGMYMPGLTGAEVLKKLKSRGVDIPALMISGNVNSKEEVIKLSGYPEHRLAFLRKPFQLEIFADTIRGLMSPWE